MASSSRRRFLSLFGFGVLGSIGLSEYAHASAADIFLDFVTNMEDGQWHSKWVRESSNEANLWEQFRDEIISGQHITPPSMSTAYGKALVAAGKMHMTITAG